MNPRHQTLSLLSSLVFLITGCEKQIHSTGIIESKESIAAQPADKDIKAVAERWRKYRNPEDLIIASELIPKGTPSFYMPDLFGKPLHISKYINGITAWHYVVNDANKKQYESLSLLFDIDNKYIGLGRKPIE